MGEKLKLPWRDFEQRRYFYFWYWCNSVIGFYYFWNTTSKFLFHFGRQKSDRPNWKENWNNTYMCHIIQNHLLEETRRENHSTKKTISISVVKDGSLQTSFSFWMCRYRRSDHQVSRWLVSVGGGVKEERSSHKKTCDGHLKRSFDLRSIAGGNMKRMWWRFIASLWWIHPEATQTRPHP